MLTLVIGGAVVGHATLDASQSPKARQRLAGDVARAMPGGRGSRDVEMAQRLGHWQANW
jgi:hypothetical protein